MKILVASILITVLPLLGSHSAYASPTPIAIQELYQKVESLGREIDQLRGNNEKINHELELLKSNQKKGFIAIDDRIDKLQKQRSRVVVKPMVTPKVVPQTRPQPKPNVKPRPVKPAVARPAVPTKPARVVAGRVAPRVDSKATMVKKAYNHAYDTLKSNRRQGINQFNLFLKKYPTSPLAENANYWIGEAKYALRDYKGAANSFVIVLNKYKSGRKAPDAAVKLGYSFYALKDWNLAKRTFQDVLRYFPKTNAAKLAQKRLQRMQHEGH